MSDSMLREPRNRTPLLALWAASRIWCLRVQVDGRVRGTEALRFVDQAPEPICIEGVSSTGATVQGATVSSNRTVAVPGATVAV